MAGPTRQDAMQVEEGPPRFAYPKVGRVVAVRQSSCSVDVVLLDGGYLRDVPVLQPWAGTTSGMMHLTAPTMDEEVWARKTYPDAGPKHRQPPHNEGQKGRDIYVLLLQAEGSSHSRRGIYAIGFGTPQVSEMLFPNVAELQDLFLHRHPSDLVTSIDWTGKWSLQHPQGARITMGPTINRVRLEARDFDKHWHLRNNRGRDAETGAELYLYCPVDNTPTHSASGESAPVVDEAASERTRKRVSTWFRRDGTHAAFTNALLPVTAVGNNPPASILAETEEGHHIETALRGNAETHAKHRLEKVTGSIHETAATILMEAANVGIKAGTAVIKATTVGIDAGVVTVKSGIVYLTSPLIMLACGGSVPGVTASGIKAVGPTTLRSTHPE